MATTPLTMRTMIARCALAYAQRMPNHRGRFRTFAMLDKFFGPFRVRTPAGPKLEVFLSSSMDLSYFRRGTLTRGRGADAIDEATPRLISGLKADECFVDVGANIGYLSLLAATVVGPAGRVIAIEPSPREYERLLHAITFNRAGNVVPVHGALGATQQVMSLEVARHHTGLNRLHVHAWEQAEQGAVLVQVPVWRGDTILPPLVEGRRVGLVKIDTEGAEVLVLMGMMAFLASTRPRHVVVEITPRFLRKYQNTKGELYGILETLGYRGSVRSDADQFDEVFEPR